MNTALVLAGFATLLLALGHSALGEILIFQYWRDGEDAPAAKLSARHAAALHSSWHLVTIFGIGIGTVLIWIGWRGDGDVRSGVLHILSMTCAVSAVYWFRGTKGKHPAWIVFLLIAALIWMGK